MKVHLGQVDDHPVRPLHGEDAGGDRAGQGENQVGLVALTGQIRRDRHGWLHVARQEERAAGSGLAPIRTDQDGAADRHKTDQRTIHGNATTGTRTTDADQA
jgi:hypothetical protein